MTRIFSNGAQNYDFVINPFTELMERSSHLYLAAPYFTFADPIRDAVQEGKSVQLLVGLNTATSQARYGRSTNYPASRFGI